MGCLSLVVLAALAVGGPAVASPVTYVAPDECPSAATMVEKIEKRAGGALVGVVEIEVSRSATELVARVDARALGGGAAALRVLHGPHCDALTDAVALVVARIARETRTVAGSASVRTPGSSIDGARAVRDPRGASRKAPRSSREPAPIDVPDSDVPARAGDAPIVEGSTEEINEGITEEIIGEATPPVGEAPFAYEAETRATPPRVATADPSPAPRVTAHKTWRDERRPRWGGGVNVLGLSGVGALPLVNLGLEASAYLRRDRHFVSAGASRWVPQDAVGGGTRLNIQLDTLVGRAGWSPEHVPIRAWGLAELGVMTGTELAYREIGRERWIALGGGFGVAWSMTPYVRFVGTFEVAIPIDRADFMIARGDTVYQPAMAVARAAFGLEVGWR